MSATVEELVSSLRELYGELEAERLRKQAFGMRVLAECMEFGTACTYHPSQWAPTLALLRAERLLKEFMA